MQVYADNAATTRMSDKAVAAMTPYFQQFYGNPSSLHTVGQQAAEALADARRRVADCLGCSFKEITFTSGGSEADNQAIVSAARIGERKGKKHIISTAFEHHAVLHTLKKLEKEGFEVELLPVGTTGTITPEQVAAAIRPDTILITVMAANNETGVVQPIRELAAAAHTVGALFHTDAIQGYLHIPLDVTKLGVDAMTVAAHKIGGPVASGALYLKNRTPLRPRIFGGGQEAGRRAGTQDLRTQLAFAAAARTLVPHVAQEREKLQALSDKLYATLTAHPRIHATMGDYAQADRLPGMVSIYVDGMDSEELIIKLDAAGFEVSAGSACSSGSMDPSHVLSAMGIGREQALGALRISFDDRVNPGDLDDFAQTLLSIVGAA